MSFRALGVLSIACILAIGCSDAKAFERGRVAERIRDRIEARKADAGESRPAGRVLGQLRQKGAKPHDSITINGLDVALWKPTTPGRHPLVLFSHGFNGCNTQSTFLTEALAANGYFVAAPNHADAKCGGAGIARPDERFGAPESWTEKTYINRRDDMRAVLDGLKGTEWSSAIDWENIALAGHSLGGYTVLALAGGWPSWQMSRVRAVLAMSPYCTPFTAQQTLGGVNVPVMYQGGTRDIGITPSVKKPGGCYDQTPGPAMFVEFDGAGHFAWADAVPSQHKNIIYYGLAFLNEYVKGIPSSDLRQKVAGVSDLRSK